jgi:redox-sensitive bicupin YhaK (pirin superfamily)
MTAAAGLMHEEYHSPEFSQKGGPFEMIQLWVNLPAKDKMAKPGYQGITADQIPEVALPEGAGTARIIAGQYGDARGPARSFTPMNVWDLRLKAGHRVGFDLPAGHTTALFVLRGTLALDGDEKVGAAELAVMKRDGSRLEFDVLEDATLLLLNGEPLNEPIVGHGPFVMNTKAEIIQAINDFNSGRFGQIAQ